MALAASARGWYAYQLQALLKEIVTRIPDIRPDGEMEMMKSIWFNVVIQMPVTFTPEPYNAHGAPLDVGHRHVDAAEREVPRRG